MLKLQDLANRPDLELGVRRIGEQVAPGLFGIETVPRTGEAQKRQDSSRFTFARLTLAPSPSFSMTRDSKHGTTGPDSGPG